MSIDIDPEKDVPVVLPGQLIVLGCDGLEPRSVGPVGSANEPLLLSSLPCLPSSSFSVCDRVYRASSTPPGPFMPLLAGLVAIACPRAKPRRTLQGPHQAAQKSTTTVWPLARAVRRAVFQALTLVISTGAMMTLSLSSGVGSKAVGIEEEEEDGWSGVVVVVVGR